MGMLGGGAIDGCGVCVGAGWNGGRGAGAGLVPNVAASIRYKWVDIGLQEKCDVMAYIKNARIDDLVKQ